jgi:hypothetical protein
MTDLSQRKGDWMQTASRGVFWPLDPRPEEVHIEDIAAALSKLCRYGGHCRRFYSVGEYSVLVSHVVPEDLALVGLLHDATEAFLVDLPRPVKRYLPGYVEAEDRLWRVIAERFGIDPETIHLVKDADNAVLLAEQRALMPPPPRPWSVQGEPADVPILGLPPHFAEALFLERFKELNA